MRRCEWGLPGGSRRVRRRRPQYGLRDLRLRERPRFHCRGRHERRGTAVGGRAGRRRLRRRQHDGLRRHEPDSLQPGPAGARHLPQRRQEREQRLQRHQRRAVRRGDRLRHGDRARNARHVVPGLRARRDADRCRRHRDPAVRGDAELRGDGERGRAVRRAVRCHGEHQRRDLHRGRYLHHDLDGAPRGKRHAGGDDVQWCHQERTQCLRLHARLYERRGRLHRHAHPGRRRGERVPDLRRCPDLQLVGQPAVWHHRHGLDPRVPGGDACDHDHAVPRRRQSHPRRGAVQRRVAQRHEQQRLRGRLHQHRGQLRRVTRRAHHHCVQRHHDLRRQRAHHYPRLQRLCQRQHGVVADHPTHLHDDGDQFERRRRVAVRLLVHGGSRRQLHDQLRPRLGHRGTSPAHRDRGRAGR